MKRFSILHNHPSRHRASDPYLRAKRLSLSALLLSALLEHSFRLRPSVTLPQSLRSDPIRFKKLESYTASTTFRRAPIQFIPHCPKKMESDKPPLPLITKNPYTCSRAVRSIWSMKRETQRERKSWSWASVPKWNA